MQNLHKQKIVKDIFAAIDKTPSLSQESRARFKQLAPYWPEDQLAVLGNMFGVDINKLIKRIQAQQEKEQIKKEQAKDFSPDLMKEVEEFSKQQMGMHDVVPGQGFQPVHDEDLIGTKSRFPEKHIDVHKYDYHEELPEPDHGDHQNVPDNLAPVPKIEFLDPSKIPVVRPGQAAGPSGEKLESLRQRLQDDTQLLVKKKNAKSKNVPLPNDLEKLKHFGETHYHEGAEENPVPPPPPQTKPEPKVERQSAAPSRPLQHSESLEKISRQSDFAKINIHQLREGDFGENLKLITKKIIEVARKEKVHPYLTFREFEKSPINKIFTTMGLFLLEDSKNRAEIFSIAQEKAQKLTGYSLTQDEFDKFVSFKHRLEQAFTG